MNLKELIKGIEKEQKTIAKCEQKIEQARKNIEKMKKKLVEQANKIWKTRESNNNLVPFFLCCIGWIHFRTIFKGMMGKARTGFTPKQ